MLSVIYNVRQPCSMFLSHLYSRASWSIPADSKKELLGFIHDSDIVREEVKEKTMIQLVNCTNLTP